MLSGTKRHQQPAYYNPEYSFPASGALQQQHQADTYGDQYSDDIEQAYGLSERYDYEEEDYKKHTKVEHHEHEVKEMSFVYPVLLALLILGALFIPFISLFFFLAVSAFNCNGGLGSSGFGQVTPFMGKRRRRRRSISERSLGANYSSQLVSNRTHYPKTETRDDDDGLIGTRLPRLVLFDAAEQLQTDNGGRLSLDYEFWRKQLARSTVRLRDALLEFGAWLDDDDDGHQTSDTIWETCYLLAYSKKES